jgi:hypothetical protein
MGSVARFARASRRRPVAVSQAIGRRSLKGDGREKLERRCAPTPPDRRGAVCLRLRLEDLIVDEVIQQFGRDSRAD